MQYRREIDGLRALAVMPVMLFHAKLNAFAGGFIGVDVFFVISGYLITSIIRAELAANKFSLIGFYERRARRILPALFAMLFTCLPLAWMWLLPLDMKRFAESVIAAVVFASNILFWKRSGYFDATAELTPTIHTWSVAVEEQYYIVFPLLLLLLRRRSNGFMLITIAILICASLGLAQWGALNRPAFSFYMLPTRAWEILLGAVTALWMEKNAGRPIVNVVAQTASMAGLVLIGGAVGVFDSSTPVPSLYTLMPTVGASLIILYASPQTLVGRLLGTRLLVGLGLLSYSAYLWHQPLLAFVRLRSTAGVSPGLLAVILIGAFIIAYFSWRYIEQPFRDRQRWNARKVWCSAAGCAAFLGAAGTYGVVSDGFKARLPPNVQYESMGEWLEKNGDVCVPMPVPGYQGVAACEFGDLASSRVVALYGDSHAQALSKELGETLKAEKRKGVRVVIDGCEVIPRMYNTQDIANHDSHCQERFESALLYIHNRGGEIIVASRWTMKLYPVENEIIDLAARNSEGGVEQGVRYREYAVMSADGSLRKDSGAKRQAVLDFLSRSLSIGTNVYVVYPVPEIAWDIARINYDYYRETGRVLSSISIPAADFYKRNRYVNELLSTYQSNPHFVPIKPQNMFCDTFMAQRCVAQFEGVPFYFDDDHLSNAGAKLVVAAIAKQMDERAGKRLR